MSEQPEYTDLINKKYGTWVEAFNAALDSPDVSLDEIKILVGTEEIAVTRRELWDLMKNSFIQNTHSHGNQNVDLNWAHSWFKRFWGGLRSTTRSKRQAMVEKQKAHADFKCNK